MVSAHDQKLTLHLQLHVEDHAPRTGDPFYHLFNQAKARLKRQGLWRCIINDELCGGGPELHHSWIEHSEANAVDDAKVAVFLGLHFDSDDDFQTWIEGPGNLEVLCANHHRLGFGIHVIPEPNWNAVRFKKAGLTAPAMFIPASRLT